MTVGPNIFYDQFKQRFVLRTSFIVVQVIYGNRLTAMYPM
jgi:hypothetical protein